MTAQASTFIALSLAVTIASASDAKVPGCVTAAALEGKVVDVHTEGFADLSNGIPLSADSVFNIASVSKQFTAFSLLLLEQRRLLSLSDRLTRWLPELHLSAPEVTLEQLLHHTGGLRDYETLLNLQGRRLTDGATQAETIALLARQRGSNASPGAEHEYSNSGYVLLATVIERASGMTFARFAQANIFEPLGMTHTHVVDRYPVTLSGFARGYAPDRAAVGAPLRRYVLQESLWEQVGDGQVHTTVGDLLRWADNFRTAALGGKALIERMLVAGKLQSGATVDYGAGLMLGEYRGVPIVWHSGYWMGYVSRLTLFPQQHFAAVALCNRNDARPSEHIYKYADQFLGTELTQPKAPAGPPESEPPLPSAKWSPKSLVSYAGRYYSEEADAVCVLSVAAGTLRVDGCASAALLPAAHGEFYAPGSEFKFRFVSPVSNASPPAAFEFAAPGVHQLRFARAP